MVQNQRTSENHSRYIDSNAGRSRGSEFSEAVARRMDKSQTDGKILEASNLRIFRFSELKAATRNFSLDTMVGEGEYWWVFKGLVYEKTLAPSKDGIGSPVAIKKLNPGSAKGFQDWLSVVNVLGKLSHPSLVKLLGYCWEENSLLLVYEFMPRGSLENYIFRSTKSMMKTGGCSTEPLSWDSRLKIAIGAARGLAFLHTSENYNARISGFDMAELGPIFVGSHVSTRIVGPCSYAAPEYIERGHLTAKSNVYCFGVV